MKKINIHTTSTRTVLPWVALSIFILGGSIIIAMYWQQNVKVKEVIVVGNHFTPTQEIIEQSQIPIGVHPDSLDLSMIIQRVEALHYVKEASPFIDALGNFKITIHERSPIALLAHGRHEMYVDQFGVKLPILDEKILNLPLVYGFDSSVSSDTLSSKEFNEIRNFLVSALNNQFGWVTISEVIYDEHEGVIAMSHENGVKLLFGTGDYDQKFKNWEVFYSEVIAYKGIQAMQQIDLRFTDQVITREVGP